MKTLNCWEWTGALDSGGYGQMYLQGRVRKAHAISKHLYDGFPIDANKDGSGLQWDHLCRNRKCVRPSHLELVSRKVNNLRGVSPAAKNAAKTHCPNGHDLSVHSMQGRAKAYGVRSCYLCHKERASKYHAKYKARLDFNREMGLKPKRIRASGLATLFSKEEALRFRGMGYSYRKIAEEIGVCESAIRKKLKHG